MRKEDEKYWDDYHTAPKAFISLAAGRKLWSSRYGRSTSLEIMSPMVVLGEPGSNARLPILPPDEYKRASPKATAANLAAELKPAEMGLRLIPIKRLGLMAASGTTPFGLLFLGFSMFIVAAALLLVALLFRLGIDGRASEVGVLSAIGLSPRQIRPTPGR